MSTLTALIDTALVALDVDATDSASCLRALSEQVAAQGPLDAETTRRLKDALLRREQLGSTGLGGGLAVPHAYVPGIPREFLLVARLQHEIPFDAIDGKPVDLVFLLTGPESAQGRHLTVLARLVRLLHDQKLLSELREAPGDDSVRRAFRAVENRHA